MKWTDEQQNAILSPVSNLLVTAAAGSGKTAVMAERILTRITGDNPTDVDKMLIVTYTNAAASEIRARIMQKITEELEKEKSDNLARQLVLIANASICTIHSFCLDIIRSNFNALQIDPNVKIGAESDINLLKKNALDNVLEKYYVQKDEVFLKTVRCYTQKNDTALVEMINKLHRFALSMPDGFIWLDNAVHNCINDVGKCCTELKKIAAGRAKILADEYQRRVLNVVMSDESFKPYVEKYKNEYALILAASDKKMSYDMLYNAFSVKFPTVRSDKADAQVKEYISGYRDKIKKDFKKIQGDCMPANRENAVKCMREIKPMILTLVNIVKDYENEFLRLKSEKGLIDFTDFEHMALKLLRDDNGNPTEIAKITGEKYDEIYIDEYQDCNNIQEEIFKMISGANRGKPNIFAVGDMKQSIYKFRDANPKMFKDKCIKYPDYVKGEYQGECKIRLNANFRSHPKILNAVNTIFTQIMSEEMGELDYDDTEMLKPKSDIYINRTSVYDKPEVCIIDKNVSLNENAESDEEFDLSSCETEALYAAERINELIKCDDFTVYDKNTQTFRHAQYRDFAVLMRGTKSGADIFAGVFEQAGIPFFSDVGGGYFDTPEVDGLLNMLTAIDNPLDDIALVSMMRHPVYGFNDTELAKIRTVNIKTYYYNAIKLYIKDIENNQQQNTVNPDSLYYKARHFIAETDALYKKSRYMSTEEFLSELINITDYFAYLGTLTNSRVRKSNIKSLIYKAKMFEKSNYRGIYNFISYIKSIKERREDSDSAKILNENDDVVRIMSIHKSKGLEFPVVFLVRTASKFNDKDYSKGGILTDKEIGIGLDYVNYERRISYPTVTKLACKENIKRAALSEEMRVLYVALTRAREKLIVTGVVKNADEYVDNMASAVSTQPNRFDPEFAASAKCMFDWIVMSVIRHKSVNIADKSAFKEIIDDNSVFDVKVVTSFNLSNTQQNNVTLDIMDECKDTSAGILNCIEYQYDYIDMSQIPRNISVSELKRMALEEKNADYIFSGPNFAAPAFADGNKNTGKISGAKYGTLIHFIMEKLDFKNCTDEAHIKAQLDNMLKSQYINEAEYEAVPVKSIYGFFKSRLGQNMVKHSDKLYKEFQFKYLMGANEIYDNVSANDDIIVQGIIDAFYIDDDGQAVLIDYKTDRVITTPDEIAEKYRAQIKYYSIALERTLEKKVKKKFIYLFDTDTLYEFDD